MIHLIHMGNRHLYEGHLAAMHRQRRDHFIVERGWPLPERDGGEFDDFDDENACYLVGFSADDEVAVSVRFRPTAETSLIADAFPHLIAPTEQPVKGADMYEATRYCAAKAFRGDKGFSRRSQLHLAMLEVMLDRGAQRLIGFMDVEFIPYFRRFSGLRLRPLGMPAPYDQGMTLAFELGVTHQDLAHARAALRIHSRQLFEAPSWLPRQADPIALARATELLIAAEPDLRRRVAEDVRERAQSITVQDDVPGVIAELAKRAA
jgi:acyl-homoserine lactone synthase